MVFALKKAPLEPLPTTIPSGYQIERFVDKDFDELLSLINASGFDFTQSTLCEALRLCLPGGIVLVRHSETNTLASSMMARHLSSPEFPFGGRIDWLASDPNYRGKGLGRLSATLATNHLIRLGYQNIWVTTQPHRLNAIKIFTSLGFVPTERTLREYPWNEIQDKIMKRAAL